MYRVSTSLKQKSWENQLRMESMTRDVFQDFEGTYADNKKTVPNGVVMNVPFGASKNSHTIGLLRNLSGSGVTGRTDQIGNEVDQVTKEFIVYSNDVSQAVNTERYGIDAHDKKAYKLLEYVQPQLSKWHKEIKGKYLREAILERYSSNLTVAPVSKTKRWNENILVQNVALASQPTYDSTNADYEEAIGDALTAAGTAADLDLDTLSAAIHWTVYTKKIEPLDNGRYVVLIPSQQSVLLKSPSATDSFAGLFRLSNIKEVAQNAHKWYLGSFGPFDMYEDPRAPMVDLTGSNSSWDITALYKGAGSDDDRTASGTAFSAILILGKGAVTVGSHEDLHFKQESQNYEKVIGVGAFAGYACNRTVYDDVGSESDTSAINQNSAVVLLRDTAITV